MGQAVAIAQICQERGAPDEFLTMLRVHSWGSALDSQVFLVFALISATSSCTNPSTAENTIGVSADLPTFESLVAGMDMRDPDKALQVLSDLGVIKANDLAVLDADERAELKQALADADVIFADRSKLRLLVNFLELKDSLQHFHPQMTIHNNGEDNLSHRRNMEEQAVNDEGIEITRPSLSGEEDEKHLPSPTPDTKWIVVTALIGIAGYLAQ